MVLDRGSLKRESKVLLKTAQVSPYLFTLVLLAIMFVINGISETLFLVKKNGGYAATKTLPSLTTV